MSEAGSPAFWPRWRQAVGVIFGTVAVFLLMLSVWWFVDHSVRQGVSGLTTDLSLVNRLYLSGATVTNIAIFSHMVLGGVLTLLVPLQIYGPLRRKWPALHRVTGRVLVLCGVGAGLGGLLYIALHGTIGGPVMDIGFALYGGLIVLTAVMAAWHAMSGRIHAHRAWALRFFVLALGSWIYRVHYGLWHALTGGIGTEPDFSGPFDVVQVFAFFLPYLAAVEVFLRVRPHAPQTAPSPSAQVSVGGSLSATRRR